MVFSEEEITKLYRVHRTLLQMLRDRNYLVPDSEVDMSKQEFKEKFGNGMKEKNPIIHKTSKDDPSEQILVFYNNDSKLGISFITSIRDRMVEKEDQKKVTRAILVCQSKPSGPAQTYLKDIYSDFRIEIFQEDELLVNITEHELVPEHQVLTKDEKEDLLQKYTVKGTQLPRMLITDPVARYYGLKRGQVVRIIRPSETAGTYITYRIVV